MKFQQVEEKANRKAPRTVIVPVSAWADDWVKRPTDDVCIGLKLPSENDLRIARAVASKNAFQAHPEGPDRDPAFVDAFRDALMSNALAVACCDPNDVSEPWPDFGGSDDVVCDAFNSQGQQFVWDHLVRLIKEHGPSEPEATDDELDELHGLLVVSLNRVPDSEQRNIRRLLGYCLRKLRSVSG